MYPELQSYLQNQVCTPLQQTLLSIAEAGKKIQQILQYGNLQANLANTTDSINETGEQQKQLDILSNDIIKQTLSQCDAIHAISSEEEPTPVLLQNEQQAGDYLVSFDPLDGSSNIDLNISVGTIFSVLKHQKDADNLNQSFLQSGNQQVASGYILYGGYTSMVLALAPNALLNPPNPPNPPTPLTSLTQDTSSVHEFTLKPQLNQESKQQASQWYLTQEHIRIPENCEFSINMAHYAHWIEPIKRYIQHCQNNPYNMRYVGSMVADINRIIQRGGIFIYPQDLREPQKSGKIRLLYESNPMALIITQAGGKATTGTESILSIVPQEIHQRTPIILGSSSEVTKLQEYYA